MDQRIHPISLGACIKPFPCVVLIYAEAREPMTSYIRKRIIPLRKGPLTNAITTVTVTVDHLTQASDQLYQRHVHHLSNVPRGQLLKILGVISQLIRGADVDTATLKTESILSTSSSSSSSVPFTDVSTRGTLMRSNFARRVTSNESTDLLNKKERKRVSFREKPQVQHFTPDSSESEQIPSVQSHLPVTSSSSVATTVGTSKQLIHLPVLSVSSYETSKRIQPNDQVSDRRNVKGARVNDEDNFDEEKSSKRSDDSETGAKNEANEKNKKQQDEDDDDDDDDVTTEEVSSDLTEQLQESSHSDRKEVIQLKMNNGSSKSNESLSRQKSESTDNEKKAKKEEEKKVIEATFSWNLDSDDEEFVF